MEQGLFHQLSLLQTARTYPRTSGPAEHLLGRGRVFDVTGRRIRDSMLKQVEEGKVQIDLTPCSGLYLLRVVADGKQVHSAKLICVER